MDTEEHTDRPLERLLSFGIPTDATGRTYSQGGFKSLPGSVPLFFGELEYVDHRQWAYAIGFVHNLELREDGLYGAVMIAETLPLARTYRNLAKNGVEFRFATCGLGILDENKVVTDYELQSVIVVLVETPERSILGDRVQDGQSASDPG